MNTPAAAPAALPALPELGKSERIFEIIRLINESRRDLTVYDLANRCGADERTVRRDLAFLRGMGYGFRRDLKGTGRRRVLKFTPDAPLLPPLGFTNAELMALYATRGVYAFLQGSHFQKAAESALRKIEPFFDPEIADRLMNAVQVKTGPTRDYGRHHDIIRDLTDAIVFRRKARMGYRSGGSRKHDVFVFHPYTLVFYSNAVYAIGYSEKHGEIRTFAVERMSSLEELDEGFETPENAAEMVSLDDHFGIYTGRREEVVLKVFPGHKGRMKDKILHPSQSFVFKRDGSMLITLRVAGKEDLFRWLLSQADAMELLRPEAWRDEFIGMLRRTGNIYGI